LQFARTYLLVYRPLTIYPIPSLTLPLKGRGILSSANPPLEGEGNIIIS